MERFSEIRDDLKNEIMKANENFVNNRFSSLSGDVNAKISDARKTIKEEIKELKSTSLSFEDRLIEISDKTGGIKDQIFEMKKSRNLLLGDVKSMNKTLEGNVDSRLRNFIKDLEKRMRTQEKILDSRMESVESKIDSVSGKIAKTKKEGEEELDELLKHVES